MPSPFMYMSPEQVMKDRADYARRNIGRGKPIVALEYDNGVLLLAENPSAMLHKVSEIYDRIAFAGVGKYDEYERLRILGIRQADLKGFAYSREDVTARTLANLYSQVLGQIFTDSLKPFEVEILIAGVSDDGDPAELYHVTFDGVVMDEQHFAAVGGETGALSEFLSERYEPTPTIDAALRLGVEALRSVGNNDLGPAQLEAAVLDRALPRRKFRRLSAQELETALGS
ncbi:MAG TPA: proteasome subunit alpha [Actinomycetota bacterium]|nr:proteasome subunit alpha [Actinomycetota bacterium]